jgi:hypothetical protein
MERLCNPVETRTAAVLLNNGYDGKGITALTSPKIAPPPPPPPNAILTLVPVRPVLSQLDDENIFFYEIFRNNHKNQEEKSFFIYFL